jgi:hypothetical protein
VFLSRKICIHNFRRWCLYPDSNSCFVFDPLAIDSVSRCRLCPAGGERDTLRKVSDDVAPLFSKHLRRKAKGSGAFG